MSEHDLRIFAGRGPQGRRLVRPSRLSGAPLAAVRLGIEAAAAVARSATAAGPAAAAGPITEVEPTAAAGPIVDPGPTAASDPVTAVASNVAVGAPVPTAELDDAVADPVPTVELAAVGPGPQAALDHRLIQILEAPPDWNQTVDAAFRNKERALLEVFASLSCADATRLHHRLASPRAGDPVSTWLTRLVPERRARLLAYLAEAPRRAAMAKVRRA